MLWKVVIDNQLYVYYNGKLIFKRWITHGYSYVFEEHGHPWLVPKGENKCTTSNPKTLKP